MNAPILDGTASHYGEPDDTPRFWLVSVVAALVFVVWGRR